MRRFVWLAGLLVLLPVVIRSLRIADRSASVPAVPGGLTGVNPGVSAAPPPAQTAGVDPAVEPLHSALGGSGWRPGLAVSLPLPDGSRFAGRLVSQSRKGGRLAWGGRAGDGSGATFFVRRTETGDYRGLIQFPGLPAVVVLRGPTPDALTSTSAPVDEHLCQGLPLPRNEPQAAALANATPQAAPPLLSSLPSASSVIYLDMDGEDVTDPSWNGGVTVNAAAPAFSQTTMTRIWERVADDFRPFNVNVTTELAVFQAAPAFSRMRCIITPTSAWYPDAGGVAYVGSFTWGDDTPCWVFNGGEVSAAEAVSHEVGHTLGLSHDGRTSPVEDYYEGHGSGAVGWAPIMGVGYYKLLVQWSRGEYLAANRTQDDLAIITTGNGFGYRPDDHGASLAAATLLTPGAGGAVSAQGNIERRTDQDGFRFTSNGGSVSFTLTPDVRSPNLDALVEIVDSANTVIASANPDTALNATLTTNLLSGTYLLRVDGVGRGAALVDGYTDYASLGSYQLTGTIANAAPSQSFAIAENTPTPAVIGTITVIPNPGGDLVYTLTAGNTLSAFSVSPAGVLSCAVPAALDFEAYPAHTLDVQAENPAAPGVFSYGRVNLTVTPVNEPPVLAALTAARVAEGDPVGTLVATAAATDPEGAVTYALAGGNEDGAFAIDFATGIITLAEPSALDGLAQPKRTLSVLARDGGAPALEASRTFEVSVLRFLVGPNRPYRYTVPASAASDALWRLLPFDDGAWREGVGGLGFDTAPDYLPYIQTALTGMLNVRAGCYQRLVFASTGAATYDRLELGIRYEDGFVAYLNGDLVASRGAPASPIWSSAATGSRTESLAVQWEWIDLTAALGKLGPLNVLAVHGLNSSANSSDFLLHPTLRAGHGAPPPALPPVLGVSRVTAVGANSAACSTTAYSAGAAPAGVLVYGLADGGTDLAAWPYEDPAGQGEGPWTASLQNLLGATTYFARFTATNAAGRAWSPATFSFSTSSSSATWIAPGSVARWRVPTDASLDEVWRDRGFDDSAWSSGPQGFGYERSNGYDALIATDVEAGSYNRNRTVYLRFPFTVAHPAAVTSLTLRVKYDDAFVAYLNGVPVAMSSNAPATPVWNSGAAAGHADSAAVIYESFPLAPAAQSALVAGTNVLAVHLMNETLNSSDLLLMAELQAGVYPEAPPFGQWASTEARLANLDPLGDADGDGASNFLELVARGDASDADILPTVLACLVDPLHGPCLRYARRLDRAQRGLVYGVEVTESPAGPVWAPWNAAPLAAPIPAGDGLYEWVTLPFPSGPRSFFRLRIVGPE